MNHSRQSQKMGISAFAWRRRRVPSLMNLANPCLTSSKMLPAPKISSRVPGRCWPIESTLYFFGPGRFGA